MTTQPGHTRHFLDVAKAEKTADLDELRDTLAEAARDAERLGLPEVKRLVDAALVHTVAQHEGEDGA